MTREEAISIMKVIVHMLEEKYDTDRVEEAVDMAIEALQQKPICCPSAGIDCEDCPAYEPKILNKWIGAEVLDRIRNEMHATAEKHEDGVYYLRDEWVDEIIDKYAEEDKA